MPMLMARLTNRTYVVEAFRIAETAEKSKNFDVLRVLGVEIYALEGNHVTPVTNKCALRTTTFRSERGKWTGI